MTRRAKKPLSPEQEAFVHWMVDAGAYAMLTYRPNIQAEEFGSAADAAALLRRRMSDIALRLDQRLFGTRYVAKRGQPERRFHGVYFLEKLDRSPHGHCVFIDHPDYRLTEQERLDRQLLLLRYGYTAPMSDVRPHDRELLRKYGSQVQPFDRSHPLFNLDRYPPGSAGPYLKSTCHVVTVYGAEGLAEYVVKEVQSSSSNFCLLNEFHSSVRQAA